MRQTLVRQLSRASASLSLFFLAGCLSRPALVTQNFTFSTPPSHSFAKASSEGPILAIHRLSVATPFDSQSLTYRTGEYSYEQDPYAQLLVPPAEGLSTPVRAWFRRANVVSDVTDPGSSLRPDLLVEVTVEQLYGDFRDRAKPLGVLEMRFVFFRAREGIASSILLRRDYTRRVPLTARTAAALMGGWNEGLKEVMDQVTADLRTSLSANTGGDRARKPATRNQKSWKDPETSFNGQVPSPFRALALRLTFPPLLGAILQVANHWSAA